MNDTEKLVKCLEILGWSRSCEVSTGWVDPNGTTAHIPEIMTADLALELVEWMRKKQWSCDVKFVESHQGKYVECLFYDKLGKSYLSTATTFCQSITDAFLKANGVEVVK